MDLTQLVDISVPLTAIFALAVVATIYLWLRKQDAGTERMQEIARFIRTGANAFLRREFLTIVPFVVLLALLLLVAMPEGSWQIALGFVTGAALSMLAVYIGMNAATRANVRTTHAARSSAARALLIAFRGGGIMGLSIVALNLLGIFVLSLLFGVNPAHPENVHLLVGFGFGASFSALFAQLGGGIFTKGADIAADLVGKVEQGIPEDDPRNAAVISDLVGDNVGEVAGRGADLFESGSDNLIGVKIIGATLAIFMFNAGGAWDNAEKYIEEGHFGGKGSEPHKASVIGDTFGDPLKDTAGPSLHILIKLQNILGITPLPLFYTYGLHWH